MKLFPFTLLLLVAIQTPLRAFDPEPGTVAQYYLAAHFVSGYWADRTDASCCPVLGDATETKIAIFVTEAGASTMNLATALDRAVKKYPQLSRSFILVSQENRDSPMTDAELAEKLALLRAAALARGVTKVSLGYLQYDTTPSRWRNSLGFFDSDNVVFAIIEPGIAAPEQPKIQKNHLPLRTVKPFYRYVAKLNSADIDEDTAESAIAKAISSLTE